MSYVLRSDFTPENIVNKLKTVDGIGSGLNCNFIQNKSLDTILTNRKNLSIISIRDCLQNPNKFSILSLYDKNFDFSLFYSNSLIGDGGCVSFNCFSFNNLYFLTEDFYIPYYSNNTYYTVKFYKLNLQTKQLNNLYTNTKLGNSAPFTYCFSPSVIVNNQCLVFSGDIYTINLTTDEILPITIEHIPHNGISDRHLVLLPNNKLLCFCVNKPVDAENVFLHFYNYTNLGAIVIYIIDLTTYSIEKIFFSELTYNPTYYCVYPLVFLYNNNVCIMSPYECLQYSTDTFQLINRIPINIPFSTPQQVNFYKPVKIVNNYIYFMSNFSLWIIDMNTFNFVYIPLPSMPIYYINTKENARNFFYIFDDNNIYIHRGYYIPYIWKMKLPTLDDYVIVTPK